MVKLVIGEYYSTTNVWRDIPYPNGFTNDNSVVIIQSIGNLATGNITFKINIAKTQYCAISIENYKNHNPYFIFIKK